jgi:hypothetical protein
MQIVKERREIPNDEREALLTLGPATGAREPELEEAGVE